MREAGKAFVAIERGHDKLDRKITLKPHITCTDMQQPPAGIADCQTISFK